MKTNVLGLTLISLLLPFNAVGQAPGWTVNAGHDAVTDLPTARASIASVDGRSRLIVKCDGAGEQVASVQLASDKFLGTGERGIIFRFDDLPAVSLTADYSSKVAVIVYGDIVILLSTLLRQSHKVTVRAWDYRQQPVDTVFQTPEAVTEINSVLTTCKYATEPAPKKKK